MKRNDLISRQQAIDVLEERLRANGYSNVALVSELNRSIGYLMRLPSKQSESNETVEWIWDGYYDEYACSYCGNLVGRDKHKLIFHNYCPCCGRKVKKERRNDEAD